MAPKQEKTWESEIKETVKLLRKQVNQVEEYSLLRKNRYANPGGYLNYEKAIEWNCASLLACQIAFSTVGTLDFVSRVATYVIKRVAQERSPAFWLAPDLQMRFYERTSRNILLGQIENVKKGAVIERVRFIAEIFEVAA